MKMAILPAVGAMAFLFMATTPSTAGTIEDLERERSLMVTTMVSTNITAEQRFAKLDEVMRRIINLERRVIRDQQSKRSSKRDVQRVFANYDLSFLVHSALERDKLVVDHWFEQLGLTTAAISNSRMGLR